MRAGFVAAAALTGCQNTTCIRVVARVGPVVRNVLVALFGLATTASSESNDDRGVYLCACGCVGIPLVSPVTTICCSGMVWMDVRCVVRRQMQAGQRPAQQVMPWMHDADGGLSDEREERTSIDRSTRDRHRNGIVLNEG